MNYGLAILLGLMEPFIGVMLTGLYSFFKGPLLPGAPSQADSFPTVGRVEPQKYWPEKLSRLE